MPKSKVKRAKRERKLDRVFDPRFIRCYANTVQIETTPMDFKFRFGEIDEATADHLLVREVVHVSMSPQHAVSFYNTLGQIMERWKEKADADAKELEEISEKT